MSDLEVHKGSFISRIAYDPDAFIVDILCRKLSLTEVHAFCAWLKNEQLAAQNALARHVLDQKTLRAKIALVQQYCTHGPKL